MKRIFILLAMTTIAGLASAQRFHRIFVDGIRYTLDYQTTTAYVTFEHDTLKWKDENYAWVTDTLFVRDSVSENGVTYPVISVGTAAFAHCKHLTTVKLPNTIRKIEESAFNQSTIHSLEIPSTVDTILGAAFTACHNLISITIPEGVDSLPENVLGYCHNLQSVTLPSTLRIIGDHAFAECYKLEHINIPESVTTLGDFALFYCDLKSFIVPANLTKIGGSALGGNIHMNSIFVDPANPVYASQDAVLFNKQKTEIIQYPAARQGAFDVPETVHTIKSGAFIYTSLSMISIPSSVDAIEDFAFYGCRDLTAIVCHNNVPPTCGSLVFDLVDSVNCTLFVPNSAVQTYRETEPWNRFVNIYGMDGELQTQTMSVIYQDKDENELYREAIVLHIPEHPEFEGFAFTHWKVVESSLNEGITIQAVYEAQNPSSMPAEVVNPNNPAQKLVRDGNVYILTDTKIYNILGTEVK